nr:acid-sensing ion channel 2-like [Parasteatoda tepidariorum]
MASLYQIICFTNSFFNYPIVVVLRLVDENSDLYPATTVCNLNPMKKIYNICFKETPYYCNYSIHTDLEEGLVTDGLFQFLMPVSQTFYSSVLNKTFDKSKMSMIEFLTSYTKLNAEARKAYGTRGKSFIKYCSFKGSFCSANDFEFNQNTIFGNCYTFKPSTYSKRLLTKQSLLLNNNNLEIILNLETDSYIEYLSMRIGALVTIHGAFEEPSIEEKGILVSPGFETHIKIKTTETKRLPAPYKDKCMDYRLQLLNPRDCILGCLQEINQEKCDCVDPMVPVHKTDSLMCNMTDMKDISCLFDVINNLLVYHSKCNCDLPCFSTNYNEQIDNDRLLHAHLDVLISQNYALNYITYLLEIAIKNNGKYGCLELAEINGLKLFFILLA